MTTGNPTDLRVYIDPPTIPAGMTIATYRKVRKVRVRKVRRFHRIRKLVV